MLLTTFNPPYYDYSMLNKESHKPGILHKNFSPSNSWNGDMLRRMTNVKELFEVTRPEELYSIFAHMVMQTYNAGKMVFVPEDSTCERIYILKEGQIDIYQISSNGKRLVFAHLFPGTVFGVRGVLGKTKQRNFAQALKDSIIYSITRDQFLDYLKLRPEITIHMLEAGYENLYVVEERLLRSSYCPAKARVAYFLLTNSDPSSGLVTNFTHEEIGNSIGAVRETVTEVLNIMRSEGMVRLRRKEIQIVDRNRLTNILGGWED